MLKTYTWPRYQARRAPELGAAAVRRVPLVIVGAGPVGLSAAIDAALRGLPVVLLDEDNTVSIGSRGVCYAKRTLEIFDRLGLGDRVVAKGVTWNVGRTFHRDREVFSFNLLPEAGHHRPGMVNLQQYHLEQYLVERAMALPAIDLRWQHKLVAVTPGDDGVALEVETAEGRYALQADWLIAADGTRSTVRRQMGLDIEGKVFQDRFLIADVVMKADFPTERWFWFDPPFHPGQSVLLHKQCDNVWRIDFQLGWDADPAEEKKPEKVIPRIEAMLPGVEFELEWVSIYQFACRRVDRFRYGRVLFAGDAAHQVSPFGARGANTGVQDIDNLAWKLQLVLAGHAPPALLDTYHEERAFAADDNLLNSTRSTDFITPKTATARLLRDAVLELAHDEGFARPLVNSGRLSAPTPYLESSLNTPDESPFAGAMRPGTNCADAPVLRDGRPGWLLESIGEGFTLLAYGAAPDASGVDAGPLGLTVRRVAPRGEARGADLVDVEGLIAERYDARPGTVYLLRPDQHVAGRWRDFDADKIGAALRRCTAQ